MQFYLLKRLLNSSGTLMPDPVRTIHEAAAI